MGEPCTPEALLEAVRGLRVVEPDLGFKPLLAKLRGSSSQTWERPQRRSARPQPGWRPSPKTSTISSGRM